MAGKITGLFVAIFAAMAWAIYSAQSGVDNSIITAVATAAMALVVFCAIYFLGTADKQQQRAQRAEAKR